MEVIFEAQVPNSSLFQLLSCDDLLLCFVSCSPTVNFLKATVPQSELVLNNTKLTEKSSMNASG